MMKVTNASLTVVLFSGKRLSSLLTVTSPPARYRAAHHWTRGHVKRGVVDPSSDCRCRTNGGSILQHSWRLGGYSCWRETLA
ncbi:hypothetical protein C8Q72DRAFT_185491 [Fomitopsis betulina]|nr:hypothetical protein C8Q72DRAFT_185491 [Fomitopsis betulina]